MARLVVLQHLEREGPGLFARIAEERGMNLCIFRLDQGSSLPELLNGDLLLVLGGPMGVRDINNSKFPWMDAELDLIHSALTKNIRVIGICLGAQLLAHAAGGDVEVLMGESSSNPLPEVGWGNIFFNGKWKKELGSSFRGGSLNVLHWHGDRILLPPSAELIASSNACKEQLFKIGPFAYGLQFHIEIDDEMVAQWINEDVKFITSALGEDAQVTLQKQQQQYGNKTLERRLFLLRRIFDLIGFYQK